MFSSGSSKFIIKMFGESATSHTVNKKPYFHSCTGPFGECLHDVPAKAVILENKILHMHMVTG